MAKKHIKHFLEPPILTASPFIPGDNQLIICNGVNPSHEYGVLKKDLGYAQLEDGALEAGKSIRSLYHFIESPSANRLMATCNDAGDDDTQLFGFNGANWSEITAAETAWANYADIDVEMENFLGYCFFVGFGAIDGFLPRRSLLGGTFHTTNTTNMPGAKFIKRYRDRLYIANCDISGTRYVYRIYFSSIPVAGAITWTPSTDFIDIDYSEQITGIEQNWDKLIIFTEFAAYMYDQASKKKVWQVGCSGQRTIQNVGAYMIWANKDNVYMSTGGRPEPIGNNIKEFLRNSNSNFWQSAVVDEEYNLYVGDSVTAGGLTYTNLMISFDVNTQMWRWRELGTNVESLAKYTRSGDDFLTIGAIDGKVHKKSKYSDTTPIYADDGNPINAHWRTKAYDLTDPSVVKKIKKLVTYTEFGNNMTIRYRIYDKNREVLMPFKTIGTLDSVVNNFNDFKKLEGNFIQFEGRERSDQKAFRFFGFSIDYEIAKKKS